jgi:hypothetical protein
MSMWNYTSQTLCAATNARDLDMGRTHAIETLYVPNVVREAMKTLAVKPPYTAPTVVVAMQLSLKIAPIGVSNGKSRKSNLRKIFRFLKLAR